MSDDRDYEGVPYGNPGDGFWLGCLWGVIAMAALAIGIWLRVRP